jgi:hypothetical protein
MDGIDCAKVDQQMTLCGQLEMPPPPCLREKKEDFEE